MVPDHFQAVVRPGKRNHSIEPAQAVALVIQLRPRCVAGDRGGDAGRHRDTAMGGVDRQFEGVREALEQGYLALGKLALITPIVGRRDPVQRLLGSIRIQRRAVVTQTLLGDAQPALPGRDTAVRAGRAFGAHRGQVVWQACRSQRAAGPEQADHHHSHIHHHALRR